MKDKSRALIELFAAGNSLGARGRCEFIPNHQTMECWTCKGKIVKKKCKTCNGTGKWIEKHWILVTNGIAFGVDTIK